MEYKKDPHLYIFTGHFGSGKTEIAVNFAMDLKKNKPDANVALIDMDIINPFFRSADAATLLENAGITVETMLYANTNVDAPALTGRMGALIEDAGTYVILDIGGDDLGARACGYYADRIRARGHTVYFVMNPFRPFTSGTAAAQKILNEIKEAAAADIDGIFDNSNVLNHTGAAEIVKGGRAVYDFAKASGIPVLGHAVMSKNPEAAAAARAIYPDGELLLMDEYVKLLFERYERYDG